MNQTAVLKFYKYLEKYAVIKDSQFILNIPLVLMSELFEQAKEMEKQQIIDAFDEGQEYEYQYHINNAPKFDSQTYFDETYGSKGSDEPKKIRFTEEEWSALNNGTSQTEISDEEIEREAGKFSSSFLAINKKVSFMSFVYAIDWYREQLKSRQ